MNKTRIICMFLAACALACGNRDDALDHAITLLDTPVALDSHLVLIDNEGDRAFLLNVKALDNRAEPKIAALPHDPRTAVRRNGADEALILSMGRRATSTQAAEPAMLTALGSDGTTRNYELGANPFDSLRQSDDGRYAFLFKGMGSARLLDNPNEVAIIDLNKAPGKSSISLRTLRSFGDSPSKVLFSPKMNIVGEDRRLAVVLSDTNVTLVDLDHLDRLETTVQLSRTQGQPSVKPVQVVFSPDRPELYVRGDGSSDIFVFSLTTRAPDATDATDPSTGTPHNDFRPSIDQLGVGGRPTDMALYSTPEGTRLLVIAADAQQAAIVDPATSQVTSVALPAYATNVMLFDAASPRGDATAQRALLYQPQGSNIMFLDLVDLAARGSRNVEAITLVSGIQKLIPMLEQSRVLILHQNGQGVSLVDLAGRTVSPITSNVPLADATFDAINQRLWVGPANQDFVGWLDLATGNTSEVLLDAPIAKLVPMLSADKIAILHDSEAGHLTVLDAKKPDRETAHSVRGFLLANLFDRGQ